MIKLITVLIVSLTMALVVTTPAFAGGNSGRMHMQQGNHQHVHQQHMNRQHMNHNNHPNMHHGQHMNGNNQIQAQLYAVGNSGVSGLVHLNQRNSGVHIVVNAFGLKPGNQYVSLYYDNHTCQLEPYSSDDVIGGIYTANQGGVGVTQGSASDPLDEINSVSVRQAGDFKLLACANVHP
jgi:hypothetical protein